MGTHKTNSGIPPFGKASREFSDLRARQMVEADRGKERAVRFQGITADYSLCEHDHETLQEAWHCSKEVVVVDEFNQVWSIYQAHKWGLINIEPIYSMVGDIFSFKPEEE